MPFPDVVIRQMWPPRVIDSPGGMTLEYFGWEESGLPASMVDDFNAYLDGVGVMSTYVRDVLRDAGVTVPIHVVANGVEPPDPTATVEAPELDGLSGFVFLHVSSAFPRKGVDVLLRAYFEAFDGSSPVSLVLKTFPNPHNRVGQLLDELRATYHDPPDVRWIDRDFEDRELDALYGLADCYVHPARGEGFGLPVAEAMAAGVPVIAVAHAGLADFVSEETAVTVPFTLAPAESHFGLAGSMWAEPDRGALAAAMAAMAARPDAPRGDGPRRARPRPHRRGVHLGGIGAALAHPDLGGGGGGRPTSGGHGDVVELAVRHRRELAVSHRPLGAFGRFRHLRQRRRRTSSTLRPSTG